MESLLPTIILRHKRENLKKCSLRGLETRSDIHFLTYPCHTLPDTEHYLLLGMEGQELSYKDAHMGIFLIDATWRYAQNMIGHKGLKYPRIIRRLPSCFVTAYPRRQDDCPDPAKGLASIEALYLSYLILGKDTTALLDHYYWKEDFLKKNQEALLSFSH
jgi:pre-rRNA-processing protein TSR3